LGERGTQFASGAPCPAQRLTDHDKRGDAGESEQQGDG